MTFRFSTNSSLSSGFTNEVFPTTYGGLITISKSCCFDKAKISKWISALTVKKENSPGSKSPHPILP
jgi:hypothetical protein